MADSKKPCAPVEEERRDNTTVFQEMDPLCAALDEFCLTLNCWYATMNNPWQREDKAYRKQLAKDLRDKLKRVILDDDKKKARLRRAQRMALENGIGDRMFTVTYQDCPPQEEQRTGLSSPQTGGNLSLKATLPNTDKHKPVVVREHQD